MLDGLSDRVKHYLVFRAPVGYSFTATDVGTDDTHDSDADADGRSGLFTLAAGQTDQRLDAGLLGSAPAFGMALRAGGLTSNAPSTASGNAVAADAAGNIVVVGAFTATADFDPGPLAYTLTNASTLVADVYVAKYSAGGALVWARRLGNTNTEAVNDVAVGANGTVIVTGTFTGTVDFDPGPGTYNLTGTSGDAFAWLLDADGNLVWARNLGGSSADAGNGVAVGADGSVYVTGTFQGTADFDPGAGTVSSASVTFTSANWSTPQTLTVTGVNDDLTDGDAGYTIATAAATSTDGNYGGLNAADVSVTNTDNDTAGITVDPTSELMTTEAGGTATFTIVLNAQPTANVTISLTSSNASEGTVVPASAAFTAADWKTPQTVTVTGVDDDLDDGDLAYAIVTAASSTDANYNGLNAADVAIINTDDDTADFMVSPPAA